MSDVADSSYVGKGGYVLAVDDNENGVSLQQEIGTSIVATGTATYTAISTATVLQWDVVEYNSGGFQVVSGDEEIEILFNGFIDIHFQVYMINNVSGFSIRPFYRIKKNGVEVCMGGISHTGESGTAQFTTAKLDKYRLPVLVNDKISFEVQRPAGGSINIDMEDAQMKISRTF